eukprot:8644419-Prorocentrum_lima.AAC.1
MMMINRLSSLPTHSFPPTIEQQLLAPLGSAHCHHFGAQGRQEERLTVTETANQTTAALQEAAPHI